MVVALNIVGVGFVVMGVAVLSFCRKPIRHPEMPGSEGFLLSVLAFSMFAVTEGFDLLFTNYWPSLAFWYFGAFAAGALGTGWILLAVGFVAGRESAERLRRPLYGCLLALPIVIAFDILVPTYVIFLDQTSAQMAGTKLYGAFHLGFAVHTLICYVMILGGTALISAEAIRSNGLRRKQSVVLSSATIPPFAANVVFMFGPFTVPYDLTVVGMIWTAVLLSWGLYRMELLDIAPVARQTAMGEMDDAVITVDSEYRVVDCNAAARTLFDVGPDYFGTPAAAFFEPIPADTLERFRDIDDVDTELSVPIDGDLRHFSLSISPIRSADRTEGRVVVLRDISPIKRREQQLRAREQELDLLRQVFSRVLRHNIRNELTVVRGVGEVLATETAPPHARQAELIIESSDDLLAISEKARHIEQLVDADEDVVEYDLRSVVEDAAAEIDRHYPHATIEVVAPEVCHVWSSPGLEAALACLLENAVEHSTDPSPNAIVEVESGNRPQVTIRDDGPGIDPEELAVLEEAAETQLFHGSGIGLWLVKWVVDRSPAELSFETDESGTAATIRFEPQRDRQPPRTESPA